MWSYSNYNVVCILNHIKILEKPNCGLCSVLVYLWRILKYILEALSQTFIHSDIQEGVTRSTAQVKATRPWADVLIIAPVLPTLVVPPHHVTIIYCLAPVLPTPLRTMWCDKMLKKIVGAGEDFDKLFGTNLQTDKKIIGQNWSGHCDWKWWVQLVMKIICHRLLCKALIQVNL